MKRQVKQRVYRSLLGHQVSFLLIIAWMAEALTTVNMYGSGFLNNSAIFGIHAIRLVALAVILVAIILAVTTHQSRNKPSDKNQADRPTLLHIFIYLIKLSIPLWLIIAMLVGLPMVGVAGGFSVILASAMVLTVYAYGKAALAQQRAINQARKEAVSTLKDLYRATLSNLAIEMCMLIVVGVGCVFLMTLPTHPLFIALAATMMMVEMSFRAFKMCLGGGDLFKPQGKAETTPSSTTEPLTMTQEKGVEDGKKQQNHKPENANGTPSTGQLASPPLAPPTAHQKPRGTDDEGAKASRSEMTE